MEVWQGGRLITKGPAGHYGGDVCWFVLLLHSLEWHVEKRSAEVSDACVCCWTLSWASNSLVMDDDLSCSWPSQRLTSYKTPHPTQTAQIPLQEDVTRNTPRCLILSPSRNVRDLDSSRSEGCFLCIESLGQHHKNNNTFEARIGHCRRVTACSTCYSPTNARCKQTPGL